MNAIQLPTGMSGLFGETTVEMYGADAFESFPAYCERVFLPIVALTPECYTIRCSLSGLPVSMVAQAELQDSFRAACAALNLDRFDTLMDLPSEDQIIEAFESIADQISIRLVMMARPAPCMIKNDGRFVMQHLSRNRQLSTLLSQFLWDTGLFRANKASDDHILHLRKVFDLADMIQAHDATSHAYGLECLNALIELDAKYRITELRLTRKESDRLLALRDIPSIDFAAITAFVVRLIMTREITTDPQILPERWTQIAYREAVFQAASREQHSNLLEQLRKANQPSNAHVAKANAKANAAVKKANPDKKPAKDKTEAQLRKERLNAAFDTMFNDMKF